MNCANSLCIHFLLGFNNFCGLLVGGQSKSGKCLMLLLALYAHLGMVWVVCLFIFKSQINQRSPLRSILVTFPIG